MTRNDNERLAVLETKLDDLTAKMVELQADVKALTVVVSGRLIITDDFEKRLNRLEKQSNLWKWLSPTLSGIFGAILTYLVLEYLKHI